MTLSQNQLEVITRTFDELFARVRELREDGQTTPEDEEFHLLFTDLDDYEIACDEDVAYHLAVIRGMALGLGFEDRIDLYHAYQAGLEQDALPMARLVAAADEALMYLFGLRDGAARNAAAHLVRALHAFREVR